MSRYSALEAHGGSIRWTTTSGQKGELPVVQAVTRGAVETLTEVNYAAPKVNRASLEQVTLELTAGDGSILARNTHDVFVYCGRFGRAARGCSPRSQRAAWPPAVEARLSGARRDGCHVGV